LNFNRQLERLKLVWWYLCYWIELWRRTASRA